MARLATEYKEKILPALMEEFSYKSVMEAPRIQKITLNMGLGEAVGDKKVLENAVGDMTAISGQKPVVTLRASPLRASRFVTDTRSAARSLCVASVCTSSWIVW